MTDGVVQMLERIALALEAANARAERADRLLTMSEELMEKRLLAMTPSVTKA
jgi:hypothetical protein